MVLPSCMGYISMPVLIGGRLFRGIATNILYSAFDTWFIEEYDRLKLRKLGYNIGRIFGYLTLIKAVSAFLSGILSELIVALAGDKGWTMVTSAFLLAVAFILIQTTWVCTRCDFILLLNINNIRSKTTADPHHFSAFLILGTTQQLLLYKLYLWFSTSRSIYSHCFGPKP